PHRRSSSFLIAAVALRQRHRSDLIRSKIREPRRPGPLTLPVAHRLDRDAVAVEPYRVAAFVEGIEAVDDARTAAGAMRSDRANDEIGDAAIFGERRSVANERDHASARAIEAALRVALQPVIRGASGSRPRGPQLG